VYLDLKGKYVKKLLKNNRKIKWIIEAKINPTEESKSNRGK
jgi:hypothetical protein